MRIGSLFSGAGGLDMAVEAVFGGTTVWHSEINKAASKVLAHRWPGVPNLGDITTVDWSEVPPVDILCGGFPCQDVSSAGRRAGIKDGTRSGLWSIFADAIDHLRPPVVVIENVRGLLSAQAHRNVEPGDATVGIGGRVPVLRAAGAVCGDLADLGYDAQWATVAAADIGAPHRRERVFIVATDAESGRRRRTADASSTQSPRLRPGPERHSAPAAQSGGAPVRVDTGRTSGAEAGAHPGDRPGDHRRERPDVALLPTPAAADGNGGKTSHPDVRRANGHSINLSEVAVNILLPTPGLSDVKTPRRGAQLEDTVNGGTHMLNLADAIEHTHGRDALLQTPSASDGAGGKTSRSGNRIDEPLLGGQAREMATAWGKYEPAIRRWEHLTGPAPAPTEPNKNGNPRLSAAFSQWLMGWPDGWVTDPAIGLSRNDQLRIVGNGVCPQQAAAALRYLIQVAGGAPSYPGAAPAASGAGALLPTPAAGNFNDGEDAKQWLARREAVKERLNNGNGMGMPLSIAVQIMATEYDQ